MNLTRDRFKLKKIIGEVQDFNYDENMDKLINLLNGLTEKIKNKDDELFNNCYYDLGEEEFNKLKKESDKLSFERLVVCKLLISNIYKRMKNDKVYAREIEEDLSYLKKILRKDLETLEDGYENIFATVDKILKDLANSKEYIYEYDVDFDKELLNDDINTINEDKENLKEESITVESIEKENQKLKELIDDLSDEIEDLELNDELEEADLKRYNRVLAYNLLINNLKKLNEVNGENKNQLKTKLKLLKLKSKVEYDKKRLPDELKERLDKESSMISNKSIFGENSKIDNVMDAPYEVIDESKKNEPIEVVNTKKNKFNKIIKVAGVGALTVSVITLISSTIPIIVSTMLMQNPYSYTMLNQKLASILSIFIGKYGNFNGISRSWNFGVLSLTDVFVNSVKSAINVVPASIIIGGLGIAGLKLIRKDTIVNLNAEIEKRAASGNKIALAYLEFANSITKTEAINDTEKEKLLNKILRKVKKQDNKKGILQRVMTR